MSGYNPINDRRSCTWEQLLRPEITPYVWRKPCKWKQLLWKEESYTWKEVLLAVLQLCEGADAALCSLRQLLLYTALLETIKCNTVVLEDGELLLPHCITNENIYFENYYNEQRKFTNDSYSI